MGCWQEYRSARDILVQKYCPVFTQIMLGHQPTQKLAKQCPAQTLFVALRSPALVSLGRVLGAIKKMVLLLLGQDLESLVTEYNSSCRSRRNERYQVL